MYCPTWARPRSNGPLVGAGSTCVVLEERYEGGEPVGLQPLRDLVGRQAGRQRVYRGRRLEGGYKRHVFNRFTTFIFQLFFNYFSIIFQLFFNYFSIIFQLFFNYFSIIFQIFFNYFSILFLITITGFKKFKNIQEHSVQIQEHSRVLKQNHKIQEHSRLSAPCMNPGRKQQWG